MAFIWVTRKSVFFLFSLKFPHLKGLLFKSVNQKSKGVFIDQICRLYKRRPMLPSGPHGSKPETCQIQKLCPVPVMLGKKFGWATGKTLGSTSFWSIRKTPIINFWRPATARRVVGRRPYRVWGIWGHIPTCPYRFCFDSRKPTLQIPWLALRSAVKSTWIFAQILHIFLNFLPGKTLFNCGHFEDHNNLPKIKCALW